MAEVNANSLPAKTDLDTNDSAIVVDQTTNAGALVDLDVLADKVLDRITSKTFTNQVGGSSAATLLAQLSTLNSNSISPTATIASGDYNDIVTNQRCLVAAGLTNAPNTQDWFRLVVVTFNNVPLQFAIDVSTSSKIYIRGRNSGVWNSWAQFTGTTI